MRTPHHPAIDDITPAAVFHALGDPTRLELLRRVAHAGELTCGPGDLPIAKSTLSNHWRVLREAGLIRTRIEGVRRWVTLRRDELDIRFPGLLDHVLKLVSQAPVPPGDALRPELPADGAGPDPIGTTCSYHQPDDH